MPDHFEDLAPGNVHQTVFELNKGLANKCMDGLDPNIWSQLAVNKAKEALTAQLQRKHKLNRPNDTVMVRNLYESLSETASLGLYQLSQDQDSPWYHAEAYVNKACLGVLLAVQGLMKSKELPIKIRDVLNRRGQGSLVAFMKDPASYKTALGEYHRDFNGDGDETTAEKRPSRIIIKEVAAPEDGDVPDLRPDPRPEVEKGWESLVASGDYEKLQPLRDMIGQAKEHAAPEAASQHANHDQPESRHDNDMQRSLVELEDELACRDTWLDEEKTRTATLKVDLALKQDQVTSLTENLKSVTESRDSKADEITTLKRELALQIDRTNELEAQNASLQDTVKSRDKQLAMRDRQIDSLDRQVEMCDKREKSLQENVKVLRDDVARHRAKNNE